MKINISNKIVVKFEQLLSEDLKLDTMGKRAIGIHLRLGLFEKIVNEYLLSAKLYEIKKLKEYQKIIENKK